MVGRLLVAWFAILVPSAQAATTVEVRSTRLVGDRGQDYSSSDLLVRGGGEASDLRVTDAADGSVVVTDTAGVVAGKDCAAQADGSARCTRRYGSGATDVDAGAGDDHVVAAGATVRGGPGADTLEGGGHLDGGPGDDVLRGGGVLDGGPGRDRLVGGPGDDQFNGDGDAPLDPDVIEGGDGTDRISYAGATVPVAVDLADPGPDGGDTVTGVEHATGGAGDDRLAGTAAGDWLDGGGGDDVLIGRGGDDRMTGRGGDDTLEGDAGDDRLDGGAGSDELIAGAGDDQLLPERGHGAVACGPGSDWIVDPGPRMRVGRDCELILVDYFELTGLRVGRTLRFSLQYLRLITPPCRTNLTVLRGSRVVATTSIRAPDFKVHRVALPVPGRGPLRLVFRSGESCRTTTGGTPRGGFTAS